MKKVWKKSMASVCAAAVVLTSANVAPAVLNVNAAVFETAPSEGEWYTTPEGLKVKLTVRYNGKNGTVYMVAGANAGYKNIEGKEITDASRVFDGDESTKVVFRGKNNDWGGYNEVEDYVQVDLENPISLYKVVFNFGSGANTYGAGSTLQYKTSESDVWVTLETYEKAELDMVDYTVSDDAIENVTAIRVVNGTRKTNNWLDIKEITIIEDKEVVVGEAYPVSKMTYSTGSEETSGEGSNGYLSNAFDSNSATYWHSKYNGNENGNSCPFDNLEDMPKWFYVQMNFKESTVIDAVNYLPRTNSGTLVGNGYITGYRIMGTTDGETWTELTSGTWDYGDGTDVQTQTAEFTPVELKAVRLEATATGSCNTTETENYDNKFANAAEISARVGEIKQVEEESEIKEYSISLEDNIGLNFYADVTDTDVDAGAQIKITTPSEDGKTTVENVYSLAELQKLSNGMYKVSGEVCAAQMTKDVKVELLVGEEVKDEGTVTVKGYAEKRIEYLTGKADKTPKEEKELTLLKAILNYGAYSQQQFNVDLDKLANDGFTDEEKNVINEVTEISDLPESANPAFEDGTYPVSAISLVLESKTTLRFYLSDAVTNVTLDGETLEFKKANTTNGTKVNFVEIEEIEAKNLGSVYTLTMSNGTEEVTVKGSPLHYLNAYINKTDSLGNLSKAVYQYWQSAKDYFEN